MINKYSFFFRKKRIKICCKFKRFFFSRSYILPWPPRTASGMDETLPHCTVSSKKEKNKNKKRTNLNKAIFCPVYFTGQQTKLMKMSSFLMENLPNEVLLAIVNYLDIKSIIKFGQVCTRTREISRDESLWRKTILFNKKVSPEFVKFILDSGCRYLSLQGKLISERKFCVFKSPKNYPNL